MSNEKFTELTVDALTGEETITELTQEDIVALGFEENENTSA